MSLLRRGLRCIRFGLLLSFFLIKKIRNAVPDHLEIESVIPAAGTVPVLFHGCEFSRSRDERALGRVYAVTLWDEMHFYDG